MNDSNADDANEETTRFDQIEQKSRAARELLYNSYNQDKLNEFMSSVENVLLIEHFLNEQNEYFMTTAKDGAELITFSHKISSEADSNEFTKKRQNKVALKSFY